MSKGKILVLAATGNVGAPLVAELLGKGEKVKAASRSATPALSAGAEAVRLDLSDPRGLEPALEGVDRIYAVSPTGYLDQVGLLGPVVEAAATRNIKVVLQTAIGVDASDAIPFRQLELRLERSGAPFVILRPNWFSDNFATYWAAGVQAGEIRVPAGEGKTSFIDARDIAAAAAGALTSDRHDGKAFALTGSKAYGYVEAAGAEDSERIVRTATVLRRISIVLGLAGAVLLAALAMPVAQFTFGDRSHTMGVALLAVAVLLRLISAGQIALVQGMRHIADLARINMLAALFSTAIGIPMVYRFGQAGIVPALVAMAAMSILTSWWYARKIKVEATAISTSQVFEESAALLKLGVVFMASGFLTVGAAYAVRIIVMRQEGFEAAGLYQAAWTLGGLYAGFILQAMGTDFYPRLTAVADDDDECNRLVNEQTQISILLAGPGLIATLTIAPLVMTLFYSPAFHPAVDVLRWICLGMMLRIVSWPMGFIVLAKGDRNTFFWTEVAATVVNVGLAWLLVPRVGLVGAGMAFFGLYIWHGILIYVLVNRMSGFRWSTSNLRLGLIFLPATVIVFGVVFLLPVWPAAAVGVALTLITGLYSLRMLATLLPEETLPAFIRPWLMKAA